MFRTRIMLRNFVRLTPSFSLPIFENKNQNDVTTPNKSSDTNTGWDRLKEMFRRNEYDEVSVEMSTVAQTTFCGFFFGAAFGGFLKSRDAYLYFIESNHASTFKSTIDAQKKLQNYVTVAFAKGAYHWGWRVGIFTGMFSLTATTISVYRGNTSLIEYITAGALTGILYKANLGTAAMFVGGLLGATLSTIGGLLVLGILKLSGISMDEIRKSFYKLKEAREDQYNQALEKAATEKHDDLTRHHDGIVLDKGAKKVEELS